VSDVCCRACACVPCARASAPTLFQPCGGGRPLPSVASPPLHLPPPLPPPTLAQDPALIRAPAPKAAARRGYAPSPPLRMSCVCHSPLDSWLWRAVQWRSAHSQRPLLCRLSPPPTPVPLQPRPPPQPLRCPRRHHLLFLRNTRRCTPTYVAACAPPSTLANFTRIHRTASKRRITCVQPVTRRCAAAAQHHALCTPSIDGRRLLPAPHHHCTS
jgi:hypothetical protein